MPSPFVGMDPFLEDPAIFPDLHERYIYWLSDFLNAALPPPYYTGVASRVWIETSARRIGPDVDVLHPANGKNGGPLSTPNAGGVAVAQLPAKPVIVRVPHDIIRETFLEIFAKPGGERVVANIEVLSMTNKTPGEQGRDLYRKKQREVLDSKVHLVEIDLLRGGTHTTAVPLDLAVAKAGTFDYHVCVHHYDNLEDYFVYPICLGARLPSIEVPLLPEDKPVTVDLQAVLDQCYDRGQYARRVRYRGHEPVPPLSPAQMEWAEKILRDKGL
jgi:hypothetical protein